MPNYFKFLLIATVVIISTQSCVVVVHQHPRNKGKKKGWYMNPHNPHHPRSNNPGHSPTHPKQKSHKK